jgi:hypothetical protein
LVVEGEAFEPFAVSSCGLLVFGTFRDDTEKQLVWYCWLCVSSTLSVCVVGTYES